MDRTFPSPQDLLEEKFGQQADFSEVVKIVNNKLDPKGKVEIVVHDSWVLHYEHLKEKLYDAGWVLTRRISERESDIPLHFWYVQPRKWYHLRPFPYIP